MRPVAGPWTRRPLLAFALALVLSTTALPASAAVSRPAGRSTLTLTSQTWWVVPAAVMTVRLAVSSPLPTDRLGLSVALYPRLRSRYAFDAPLSSDGPPEVVPDAPNTIPLEGIADGPRTNGVVQLSFDVAAPSAAPDSHGLDRLVPDCAGGICGGVYPLEIELLDTFEDVPLASLVTDVVYSVGGDTSPLNLGIVVPVGIVPSLGPDGTGALSPGRLQSLNDLVSVLRAHRRYGLSLAVYPELLVALAHTGGPVAANLLANLKTVIRRKGAFQLLGVPFAPVDVSALSTADLTSALSFELSTAETAETQTLGESFSTSPYVSFDALTGGGLGVLSAACPDELVVPESGVAILGNETPTSPFVLSGPGRWDCGRTVAAHKSTGPSGSHTPPVSGPVTMVSDAGLDGYFAAADPDPVLLAHRFLAEVSQIFFQDPFAPDPRGVVVAPGGSPVSPRFLSALLEGLAGSPIIRPETLSTMFSTLPVGANGGPTSATLGAGRNVPTTIAPGAVRGALTGLRTTIASILPSDGAERQLLADGVSASMAVGLSARQRAAYTGAVGAEISRLGDSLNVIGSPTVTLTARTGKLPITIAYDGPRPAHIILRLKSSELGFPGGTDQPLVLNARDNPNVVRVSAPTSGAFHLTVELVAPKGDTVLLEGRYTVHSTAVSGVAIALSLAALAVLAAWWLRSVGRSRRRRAGVPGADGAPSASS